MSLEAWGDEGDGMPPHEYDALTDAGWLTPDDAEEIKELVRALVGEAFYENGVKANGVAVRFLMRMTLLQARVGLDVSPVMVEEAKAAIAREEGRAL